MTYNEILSRNPAISSEASSIANALAVIVKEIRDKGFGTASLMAVVGEIGKLALTAFPAFQALAKEEKVVVLGEVFDNLIGSEDTALIHQLGFIKGEAFEGVSDALKVAAASYFLEQLENAGIA